jgi:hypothetical protein
MNIMRKTKERFTSEIEKIARTNVIMKLKKHGVDYRKLPSEEFEDLLEDEIMILESDTKKVGAGIGIGLVISMLTGI